MKLLKISNIFVLLLTNMYHFPQTFITATFLTVSTALSLFAILLDGPDWNEWKNADRTMKFWEGKDAYSCSSNNKTCRCQQDGTVSGEYNRFLYVRTAEEVGEEP